MATDLEVFLDTVNHREPERVLYHFGCTPDLDRRLKEHVGGDGDYYRHYGCFMSSHLGPKKPETVADLDFRRYWENETLPAGTRINENGVAEIPSGYFHFWGYVSPLRNAENLKALESYPIHDLAGFDYSHYGDQVRQAHRDGVPAVTFVGHMYETAWQIRGYEQFLEDMIERPAWAECLLERLFRNNLHKAVEAAKAGADAIYCGDDVANQRNMMFSIPMWRSFMRSRWEQIWRAVKEVNPAIKTHYHSDGNVMSIVGELVEAGLDILNPVQPEAVDTDEIHRKWGDRISFDGCIGTQSTMPWGSPADVKARVKYCIENYGRNGGLILSPTHVLEPEVPIANIEAFVSACRSQGHV